MSIRIFVALHTMNVLVTGGAGYIGSHTVLELLTEDMQVTVMDNLNNSSEESLRRVQKLTGKTVAFHKVDLLDVPGMDALFAEKRYDAVIHFAGHKAVGESVAKPLMYYENNITGTVNLLHAMEKGGCRNIVFSSSATVYGDPAKVPVDENSPISATNPYGRTKLFIEYILRDFHKVSFRVTFGPLQTVDSAHLWPPRAAIPLDNTRHWQPLCSNKVNARGICSKCKHLWQPTCPTLTPTGESELECGHPALLQPGGRTLQRSNRGRPQRHPQQFNAVHSAGNLHRPTPPLSTPYTLKPASTTHH